MASNVFGAAYTPPASIYYFGASPTSIVQGGASTISWNVVNAYTCYGSGGWSGLKSIPSGSSTVSPNSTTTYTLTCNNEVGATTSRSITINVTPKTISPSNTCSCYNTGVQCSITDNGSGCTVVDTTGTSVSYCQPGTLVTTYPPYCTPTLTATASPSSLTLSSGSSASTTITMNGSNLAGGLQLGTDPATANVGMSLSNYNPSTIPMPQAVTLTITANNLSKTGYVTVSINYGGATSYMLNIPVTINTTTTPAPTVDLKVNGTTSTTITYGQSARLDWVSTNTTSCSTLGSAVNGYIYVSPQVTTKYTQKCTNSNTGLSVTSNPVLVTVTQAPPPGGTCGSSNGGSFYTAPTTNLCSSGTASAVTGSGPWNWSCSTSGGSASCSANKKVDGVCSATHYACIAGASANNVNGSTAWTWSCLGSNGGTTASCSESKVPPPSGTLTPDASGCTIQNGSSTCKVTVSWNTVNPVGTSSVTSNTTDAGTASYNVPVATGNSGYHVPFTVHRSSRWFYLYNNGGLLDSKNLTADCASGSAWDVSSRTCVAGPPAIPTGLTATTVSSSQINLSWNASTGGNGSRIAYNIYRCAGTGCTPNQYIGWGYSTSYSDTGLSSNTTYGYRVRSYDSRGVASLSGYSTAAYAATPCLPDVSSFATNSTSVPYNGSTTLTWAPISCATSCTASSADGRWSGAKAVSGGNQTISPLLSTTSFSLSCTGTGGSASATVTVSVGVPPPTGSVASSSSCSIPLYASTCDSAVTWSTQNLTAGALTAVTKDNPSATVSTATSGTNVLVPVKFGRTTFFLSHNGATLGSSITDASCASGTYDGLSCVPTPVNGACSSPAIHYTCVSGTSANNVSGLTTWTWDCNGSNGGTNAVGCSQNKGVGDLMSGTLSGSSSCTIPANGSSCSPSPSLNWSINNPVGTPTAITASGMSDINVSNSLTPASQSGVQSVTVPYPGRIFYLYNSAQLLNPPAGFSVTANCASGTNWNPSSQKCLNIPPPAPNVTFSANPSSVVKGSASTLTWSSTNATSCIASGDWSGSKTASSTPTSESTGPLTVSKTYTLTCVGAGGTNTQSATVTVTVVGKKPIYKEN